MKNSHPKNQTLSSKNASQKPDTRINSLISRGLATENVINKNDVINEIYSIWQKENKFYLKKLKLNVNKEEELEIEKKRLEKLIKNFEDTKKCTSFYKRYTQIPENKKDSLKSLIDSIQILENKIVPKEEITKPYLLQKILKENVNDDAKRIQLLDLYYRRSEELSYTYQRKIIDIEHSQYMSLHLKEQKYSNVTDLVNAYRISKAENEALKVEESSIFTDSILKRRHFSQFSNEFAQNFVSTYQTDFKANINVLKWNKNKQCQYFSTKEKSFDDIVNDPLFLLSPSNYSNEFQTETCQNEVKELIDDKSSTVAKLKSYKIILKDFQNSFQQLETELNKIRRFQFSKNNQTKGHLEKLWDINDKLFAQMQKFQDYIDSSSKFHQNMFEKILKIINDREIEAKKWYIAYYKYIDLIKDHSFISFLQSQNAQMTLSLFSVCLYFASKSIEKSTEKDEPGIYLYSQFQALLPKVPTPAETPPPTNLDGSPKSPQPNNLFDLLALKMKKKTMSPSNRSKSHKSHKSGKSSSNTSQILTEEEAITSIMHELSDVAFQQQQNLQQNPSIFLTKIESLILAAKCIKCVGFLQGLNNSPYDLMKKLMIHILSNSHVRLAQFFQDFSNEFFANLHLIYELALPYLVVEKQSVAIQTDPPVLKDMENQTMDQKAVKEMMQPPKKKK